MSEILYPQLSYQIVGACFAVYNELGTGHKESCYEEALAVEFAKRNLRFKRQAYIPLAHDGKIIGKQYFDFLVEDKIVVELKRGNHFHHKNIEQVYQYLIAKKLQLGIIAQFTEKGAKIKRVINLTKNTESLTA